MSIEILILAFGKAEKEIGSSKKTHLAQHLSDILLEEYGYQINERTLRDHYTNHKNGRSDTQEDLKPKLISCLCDYLGYRDYADFVGQNRGRAIKRGKEKKENEKTWGEGEKEEEKTPQRLIIIIGVALVIVLLTTLILQNPLLNPDPTSPHKSRCMTWADSLYMTVSCDTGPYSEYRTQVEPLDKMKLKNFKKIEVNMTTQFFSENAKKPLIWYFKNKDGEIEYYTAPGLHPITGKTLREITPYIIQTHVPLHSNKKDSFLDEN